MAGHGGVSGAAANYIVFQGVVQLHSWCWDSTKGRQVRFSLGHRAEALDRFNELRWVKKAKKAKPGDTYQMSVADQDSGEVIGMMEVWFRGSSYGNNMGAMVTFELADQSDFELFTQYRTRDQSDEDWAGKEMAIVIVQLDADGNPIDQEKRKRVLTAAERKQAGIIGGAKSKHCAMVCARQDFGIWFCVEYLQLGKTLNEEQIAARIRNICGIGSRAELDRDDVAWMKWSAIESQYVRHRNADAI